jgi:hypothetical protein
MRSILRKKSFNLSDLTGRENSQNLPAWKTKNSDPKKGIPVKKSPFYDLEKAISSLRLTLCID